MNYTYDQTSMAFYAAGATVYPCIVERNRDGTRCVFPVDAETHMAAGDHLLALLGCLDAPVLQDRRFQ